MSRHQLTDDTWEGGMLCSADLPASLAVGDTVVLPSGGEFTVETIKLRDGEWANPIADVQFVSEKGVHGVRVFLHKKVEPTRDGRWGVRQLKDGRPTGGGTINLGYASREEAEQAHRPDGPYTYEAFDRFSGRP